MHDKVQYYTGNTLAADHAKKIIPLDDQEIQARRDDHGNYVGVKADERVHYHKSLLAGQNTANMCIARLLMRSLASSNHPGPSTSKDSSVIPHQDKYNPDEFLEQFVLYMKTPPTTTTTKNQDNDEMDTSQVQFHNDTYLDVYVRSFFKEASLGVPLRHCAKNQRDSWSIGSLDGVAMVIPIIAAYAHEPECMVLGRAVEQHMLTHRSITVTATLYVLVPLLLELFHHSDNSGGMDDSENGVGVRLRTVLDRAMDKMRPPAITGRQMCDSYVQHRGPGNIPKQDKWRQHMSTSDNESMKDFIHRMVQDYGDNDEDVAGWGDRPASQLSTACYCEQAFAVVLYLAYKYAHDPPQTALLQNVMLGGHSTSRGAVLGAILGAAHGSTTNFPFVHDLSAYPYIAKEIQDLVDTV
jgi:ADP-ribosyl-[dinitrogen reductase] hydrolase